MVNLFAAAFSERSVERRAPPGMPLRGTIEATHVNVVRPNFAREDGPPTPTGRPELAEALGAIVQASDLIRAAQERAGRAEERLREMETDMKRAIRQIEALNERIVKTDEQAQRAADRSAEALAGAETQIVSARDQARSALARIEELEQRADTELEAAKIRVQHAENRAFSAETRAMEAREDLSFLEACIRKNFEMVTDTPA